MLTSLETGAVLTKPKELVYSDIPELTAGDVLPGWGFTEDARGTKNYFQTCLVRALQDPDWLLFAKNTPEYEARKASGLPVPQSMTQRDLDELNANLGSANLEEVARQMNRVGCGLFGGGQRDVVVRALEIMTEDHPNLAMFRGTSFHGTDSNGRNLAGIDFSPGYLPIALDYAEKGFLGKRTNPVLAIIGFKDLIREYTTGNIGEFYSEGGWWRGSMVIVPNKDAEERIVKFRRMPPSNQAKQAVVGVYMQKGITL